MSTSPPPSPPPAEAPMVESPAPDAPPPEAPARPSRWQKMRSGCQQAYQILKGQPSVLDAEALAYQPNLEQIIEGPPPRSILKTFQIAGTMLVSLLAVAALCDMDIVVMGPGRLATADPPVVLQALDRSLIRSINVKQGETVHKGQILATLDPTFTQADVAQLSAQKRIYMAQIARMEAELAQKPYEARDLNDSEQQIQSVLYRQRQAQYAAKMLSYDEEINQLSASLRTLDADRQGLERQIAVAQEIVGMRQELMKSQSGSRLNYLDSQDMLIRSQRELQSTINRSTETRHNLASKQAERQAFSNQWNSSTLEELVKVRQDAAKVDESMTKATRMFGLVEMTAPEDGVVVEVAKKSEGSVAREAEALITMVRSDTELLAEIDIASADIGYAKVGDPVKIKVDAFPYQRHGMLDGTLTRITQESVTPGSGGDESTSGSSGAGKRLGQAAFHRAHVVITKAQLRNLPEGTHLIPGMTLTAEVKVGTRRIIAYFLYPVLRGFDESLREP